MSIKFHSSQVNQFKTRYFSSASKLVDSSGAFSKTPYHALARKKKVSKFGLNSLEPATTRVRMRNICAFAYKTRPEIGD